MEQVEQQSIPQKEPHQKTAASSKKQDAQYFANRHDVTESIEESIDETIDRVGLFDTNANSSQKNMAEPSFEKDCL